MGWAAAAPYIMTAIGSIGSSMSAPTSFQPRQGYGGNTALEQDTKTNLDAVAKLLNERANAPISLPDATVGALPSFHGGGLPMDIGVLGADQPVAMHSLDAMGNWSDTPSFNPNPNDVYHPPSGPPGFTTFGGNPNPTGNGGNPGGGGMVDPNVITDQSSGADGMTAFGADSLLSGGGARRQSMIADTTGMPGQAAGTGDPTQAALSLLWHVASGGGNNKGAVA